MTELKIQSLRALPSVESDDTVLLMGGDWVEPVVHRVTISDLVTSVLGEAHIVCDYCGVGNKVSRGTCSQCGGPLPLDGLL